MELSPLIGYLAGAGGLAMIAGRGLNFWSKKRGNQTREADLAQRAEILENTYTVRPDSQRARWRLAHANGEGAYAFVGSYALNLFPEVMANALRIGCDGHMGGKLLVDFERQRRYSIMESLPEEVRKTITLSSCPNLPGGFHSGTADEVDHKEHLWGADLRESIRAWLRYIEQNNDPEFLVIYASPGSHHALVPTIVRMYKARYPDKPVYVITMLDDEDIVRARFPAVRQRIMQDGLVQGMIVTDNRRNRKINDRGITLLLPALSAGGWLGDTPLQMTNILGLMFAPETRRHYGAISTWAETIAVKHIGASEALDMARTDDEKALLGERYFTRSNLVEEKIPRGIKTLVAHPEYQAISLPPAPFGALRTAISVAPILPDPDFARASSRIESNLEGWRQETDRNLRLNFASIGVPLTPDTTEAVIAVVLLQPLDDDGSGLDALARNETPKLLTDGQPAADVHIEEEEEETQVITPPRRGPGRPRKEPSSE